MSFEFVKKLMDSFSLEDFTIIKLMEEIAEIEQEISLKKKAMDNRLTLLRRLLQKHENEEIRTAIQSFLMKIENEDRNMLGYGQGHAEEQPEGQEENKDNE